MRTVCLLCIAAALHAGSLEDAIRARTANFDGTVSLYARNLETGRTVAIRATDPVRTASTIKLAIMTAVFDAVARGHAQWTEPLTVTAADKVSGTGILGTEISDGVQLPLRDVVNLMIVLSDNTATNMILRRFSADAVNLWLDRIDLPTTRSLRKVMGGEGHPADLGWSTAGKLPVNQKYGIGVSTPKDMVTILERLQRGELVSPAASQQMLAILKRNQDNTGIARHMEGLTVAHKTGALEALRADVGIVYTNQAPIAMAIYVDNIPKPDWSPDNPGSILISQLAKQIVEGLSTAK